MDRSRAGTQRPSRRAKGVLVMAMIGIAIILFGIVRRLWVRVESVKESLQVLAKRGGGS